jgi:predicted esterase
MNRPQMSNDFDEIGEDLSGQDAGDDSRGDFHADEPRGGMWSLFIRILRVLLSHPWNWRVRRQTGIEFIVDEGSAASRIARGIVYRLALLPVVLMLIAAGYVYFGTHPAEPMFSPDPISQGVYYEPVNLLSDDKVRLEGWLAPAIDARQVLADGDRSLQQRWPAVILVHGFGMTRQQMLPLFKPLHDHGWIVLAIGLRGEGTLTPAGQTFGLNESLDVKAAIQLLRRRPFVDASRIAIVGIGSGANAAVIAAESDFNLAGLVLDSPAQNGDEAISAHIDSKWPIFRPLHPLGRLAFELGYGVDVHDLDLSRYSQIFGDRPTLLMRSNNDAEQELPPDRVKQITDFLAECLDRASPTADIGK